MMRKISILFFLVIVNFVNSQELNCNVVVNYDKIGATNTQIFKTLQNSLNDFVNKNAWTEQKYKQNEKINCSMFITVNGYDNNQFDATLQVQSSRPVFNSSYSSPIININDKDFNFKYIEFENLTYSPNSFDSNLMSVIAFYCNLIIGTDAESFEKDGGLPYYQNAQDIVSLASSSGYKGWSQAEKSQNRYFLINDIVSPTFSIYRETLTKFHLEGLDKMSEDPKTSKALIKDAIVAFTKLYNVRPNSYLTRTFFDAKSDEIIAIFSDGPTIPIDDLIDGLNKISPTNSSKWSQIKF
jgi:Domain of unknown function (DUF4835)